jgi:hypothetical protein
MLLVDLVEVLVLRRRLCIMRGLKRHRRRQEAKGM